MKAFLIKAWHDPVGSKVISGIILAVAGVLAVWAKSGFSSSAPVIWASAIAIGSWLARPLVLPLWVVVITLLTFAAIVWWLIGEHRHRLRPYTELLQAVKEASISQLSQQAKEDTPPAASDAIPRYQNLDESSQRLIQLLLRSYPDPVSINAVVEQFNLAFPVVEWIAENLGKYELIRIIPADRSRDSKIVLTKAGRNYCMDNSLDLVL